MRLSMNNRVVLDASALLALIQEETGAEIIKPLLKFSVMSVVNVTETLSVLQRTNISPEEGLTLITDIVTTIVPFDLEQAEQVAKLHPLVQPQGLSLADRACIALGIRLQIPIYTADRIWDELKLDNIDIRLIR
jgi:PIN domain nuclease of toxin-antitoxin system